MKPLIFLPIFIDSCSSSGGGGQLPTGSSSECLEGLTTKLFLAKSAYRFSTIALFKTQATWDAAILAKDIVPLFPTYEVVDANTEATEYESRNFSYQTEKEVKKVTFESYLDINSHAALKSYENGDYTQVFEVTEAREILGVYDADGVQVKGQDLTRFDVSIRSRPTSEKPAYSMTTITYRDFEEFEDNGIIVKPDWDANTLDGVFNLTFQIQGTPTATTLDVKVTMNGGQDDVNTLVLVDFYLEDALGADQTSTMSGINVPVNGIYNITGTGMADGLLRTNGVIDLGGSGVLVEGLGVAVIQ
jgi:hypothetical protein